MRRVRRLAWMLTVSLPFAVVLALSAWHLGGLQPLALLPLPHPSLGASPLGPWPTLLALVLLLPALWVVRKPGREVAGLTALATGVLLPAAYPWSTLDWSRLLKDWGLSHGGTPGLGTLALASLPYAYVLALHTLTLPRQAQRHFEGKGIPGHEVRRVTRRLPRWSLVSVGGGVATTLLAALALGVPLEPPSAGALGAPLLVALLVVGATAWLLRTTAPPGEEETAEGDGDAPPDAAP